MSRPSRDRPASGFNPRDRHGRHRPPDDICHDCAARIAWATTSVGGRAPFDLERLDVNEPAYVLLERPDRWRLALEIVNRDLVAEAQELGLDVRTLHFDTCPVRRERLRPRLRKDLE